MLDILFFLKPNIFKYWIADLNFFLNQKNKSLTSEIIKIQVAFYFLKRKNNQLKQNKGFRNIFEAIIKYRKIIIGHNCILDINFIISHFGDNLPNSYNEWKKLILNYFEK